MSHETSNILCSLPFSYYKTCVKVGSEGRRLPALKFVESVVLLYTPDPDGSLEPPSDKISDGISFSIFLWRFLYGKLRFSCSV